MAHFTHLLTSMKSDCLWGKASRRHVPVGLWRDPRISYTYIQVWLWPQPPGHPDTWSILPLSTCSIRCVIGVDNRSSRQLPDQHKHLGEEEFLSFSFCFLESSAVDNIWMNPLWYRFYRAWWSRSWKGITFFCFKDRQGSSIVNALCLMSGCWWDIKCNDNSMSRRWLS